MYRFNRNDELEMGEYVQLNGDTGLCRIPTYNDEGETFVVSHPDGTMPDDISDLELFTVPFSVDYDPTA